MLGMTPQASIPPIMSLINGPKLYVVSCLMMAFVGAWEAGDLAITHASRVQQKSMRLVL